MQNFAEELPAETQAIVERVEKLLRLAARNPNEHEAANATAKAMELLAAYNLDMETVKQNTGDGGKRVDESLKGGHFQFQRDLWAAVAKLNYCMYWSMIVPVRTRKFVPNSTGTGFVPQYREKNTRQHRVVGRIVNARMTKVMSEYLEQAIDRALRERIEESNEQFRGTWATSFREGCADGIISKINARRREMIADEKEKARKAAEAAAEQAGHEAAREGVSTGRAITLANVVAAETEANLDFLYGEGYCAKQAKARADEQQRRAAANAYYAKWREENPVEVALQDAQNRQWAEEDRKREEKNRRRRMNYVPQGNYRASSGYKGDRSAFYEGQDASAKISIDQQADHRKAAGALG